MALKEHGNFRKAIEEMEQRIEALEARLHIREEPPNEREPPNEPEPPKKSKSKK